MIAFASRKAALAESPPPMQTIWRSVLGFFAQKLHFDRASRAKSGFMVVELFYSRTNAKFSFPPMSYWYL